MNQESMQHPVKEQKILYAASKSSHLRRFHAPYIENMRRCGHKVFLMANGEGVDFPIPFQKSFFSPVNLRALFAIRKILRREKFDRVILNTSLAAFLVRMAMAGMRQRPKVLNIVHGYLFPYPLKGMKDRLLLLCEKLTRRYTDQIAVMNEDDLNIAMRYRLCKGHIHFLNGMGFSAPVEIPEPDSMLRSQYTPDEGDRLLTFVGELSVGKNQIFLVRALARLRKEGLPLRLLLVGEGNDRARLEREVETLGLSDSVFLIGNQEPVFPYLSVTDLYVSASRKEGLAFNLMEAMSFGLPMLVSDVKGQKNLLKDRREMLYPADDEQSFCEMVHRWYASGIHGINSVSYPEVEQYRLNAVFEKNLAVIKGEWKE